MKQFMTRLQVVLTRLLLNFKYILGHRLTPIETDRVKLCFDKTIKDCGIAQLIEDGYLSHYNHWTITNKWSPSEVFKFYIMQPEVWGKTIAYFHTIAECLEFQELLNSAGVSTEVVTGSSNKWEQLKRFKKDPELKIISNCMMLTEGFDYPALNTVFCRPSCRGLTVQMAGRVFRKWPGKPIKNVVQCNQTRWPFLKTARPDKQFIWSGTEWRGLTPNDNATVAHTNVIHSIAKINVELPKMLMERKAKRRTNVTRIEDREAY